MYQWIFCNAYMAGAPFSYSLLTRINMSSEGEINGEQTLGLLLYTQTIAWIPTKSPKVVHSTNTLLQVKISDTKSHEDTESYGYHEVKCTCTGEFEEGNDGMREGETRRKKKVDISPPNPSTSRF
jgi:hypothetical protein